MRKTKRSAFTIVELVIVIAVIAILSAVLIPTFGAIIKNANVAADQSAAATLTTELHIYLKGETIDSEAELMDALDKSGIGEKLVPKAAQYGNHFWFDMDNQMIIAKTAEEVEAMIPERATASIQSRTALITDGERPAKADVNFRDIYGIRLFFIDKSGSSLVDLFEKIDAVKDETTYNDIALYTLEEGDKDYALVNKVLTAVKSTVILSDYGAFYCTGAESYGIYVAKGTKCITKDRYLFDGSTSKTTGDLPALKGTFALPESVLDVATGALNFTGSATIKVPYDAAGIKSVFGPQSTNARITGVDNDYMVDYEEAPLDGHAQDRLVLANDNTWVADLVSKLPFADFKISFDVDSTSGADQWNNGNLYMFYGDFKETENQFNISFGEDNTVFPGTSDLITWTSSTTSVADFNSTNGALTIAANADPTDRVTTITASAVNINGETETATITLTMVKPTAATVGVFDIPDPETYSWKYTGRNGNINFDLNVIYNDNENWDIAVGTSSLVVDEDTAFEYADDKLTLKTDANGKIYAGTRSFDLIVDGCLTENVTIDLQDQSDSPITHKFHKDSERVASGVAGEYHYYNFYIGNLDAIKLSDIIKFKEGVTLDDEEKLTVKVYVENSSGDRQELVGNSLGVSVELDGTAYAKNGITITPDDLDKTIKFSGTNDPIDGWKVVIEIEPENYGAFSMEVVAVNGNNVTSANASSYIGKSLSNNIVLLSDLTITSGQRFEVGAKTFYGNGFIIDATGFTAANKKLDYVISLNGGTVDNVYINGPVYPTLDFSGDNSTSGYQASGIAVAGLSTIKNSYVSNFRQPVRVDTGKENTDTVSIVNSTFEGGRFANIVWVNGELSLTDVTTIQSVVQSGTTQVLGAGIYGGPDDMNGLFSSYASNALNSALTINGHFNQYNWIAESMTSAMPTISIEYNGSSLASYNVGAYFSNVIKNAGGSYTDYQEMVHVYTDNETNTKYMNGGIMFLKSALRVGSADWNALTRTVGITDNRTNTNKKAFADIAETRSVSKKIFITITVDIKAQVFSYSKYSDEAKTEEVKLTSADLNYTGRYLNYGSN